MFSVLHLLFCPEVRVSFYILSNRAQYLGERQGMSRSYVMYWLLSVLSYCGDQFLGEKAQWCKYCDWLLSVMSRQSSGDQHLRAKLNKYYDWLLSVMSSGDQHLIERAKLNKYCDWLLSVMSSGDQQLIERAKLNKYCDWLLSVLSSGDQHLGERAQWFCSTLLKKPEVGESMSFLYGSRSLSWIRININKYFSFWIRSSFVFLLQYRFYSI